MIPPEESPPCNIYLDNIYFWKTPIAPESDATVSSIEVDGTPLPNFSIASYEYTYHLVIGTTTVPQITNVVTSSSSATVTSLNQAPEIPGDAVIVVTSEDLSDTKTYTVSFVADIPTPCPTPVTPDNEVLSIYGDTAGYTNIWIPDYGFGGLEGEPDLDPTDGVNKAMKLNLDVAVFGQGTNGGTVTDITAYNYLHFDYFASADTDQIQFTLIEDDGGVHEFYYELSDTGDAPLAFMTWTSVNIPLSYYENLGFSKDKFFQYKIGSAPGMAGIAYFDNIYFSVNEPVFKTDTMETLSVKAYPNPASEYWSIATTGEKIISVTVYDMSGKHILGIQPQTNTVRIDGMLFKKGLYFAKVETGNGVSTLKLIKE